MQKPSDEKRDAIRDAAAKLFASKPYHEVRLDDVVAAAGIGKGTLYVYFKSKDELFAALVIEAFEKLVESMEHRLSGSEIDPRQAFRIIVSELVRFAVSNPHYFEMMRVSEVAALTANRCHKQRDRLTLLIRNTIASGVRCGVFRDPHPELTALFVPGLVRAAMLFGPKGLTERTLGSQIVRILEEGLLVGESQVGLGSGKNKGRVKSKSMSRNKSKPVGAKA
jgi:AcrR family transcriptional regulator